MTILNPALTKSNMLRMKTKLGNIDYEGGSHFVMAMDSLRRTQYSAIDKAIEAMDAGEMKLENVRAKFVSVAKDEMVSIFLSQEFDKVVVKA